MKSFRTKHPEANLPVTYGLEDLATGETITSAVVTISVLRGSDPNAAAMLSGLPQIAGNDVLQRVQGGVDGVDYELKFVIDTSLTPNKYVESVLLPVRKSR